jgi:uncharacterized protein (TIGR03067 family)
MEKWPSVAGWLVQVARRTALQAQAKAARRHKHEQLAATMSNNISTIDPADAVTQQELAARLDAELVQLPSKYRLPLVLCQLEGQTKEETAKQLGWPVGSVSGRLARGKKLLHDRLVRSGFAPSLAAGALALSKAEAELPALLVQATTLLASSAVHQTGTLSKCAAVTLAQGVMTTMFVSELKYAAMVLMVLGLSAGTAAWAWQGSGTISRDAPTIQSVVRVQKAQSLDQLQGNWKCKVTSKTIADELRVGETSIWFDNGKMGIHPVILRDRPGNYKLNEKHTPGEIDFSLLQSDATLIQYRGIFTVNNGVLSLAASEVRYPRPTSFEAAKNTSVYVGEKFNDYDRLQGIWRYEERNPVTNDLDQATELIFKKNMYVRRVYTKGSIMESKPLKFQLNEKASPKQLDLEIRSVEGTDDSLCQFNAVRKRG